jgi:hypothetical protein
MLNDDWLKRIARQKAHRILQTLFALVGVTCITLGITNEESISVFAGIALVLGPLFYWAVEILIQ